MAEHEHLWAAWAGKDPQPSAACRCGLTWAEHTAALAACAGTDGQHDEDWQPTCFPDGCEHLNQHGECPGYQPPEGSADV